MTFFNVEDMYNITSIMELEPESEPKPEELTPEKLRFFSLMAAIRKINELYKSFGISNLGPKKQYMKYIKVDPKDDSKSHLSMHRHFYDAVEIYSKTRSKKTDVEAAYKEAGKLIRGDKVKLLDPSFFEQIGKDVPRIREVTNISEKPEEFLGKLLTQKEVFDCLYALETAVLGRSGDPRGHTGTGKVVDFSPEDVKILLYFGSDPYTRDPTPPTLPERKFGGAGGGGGRGKPRTASTRRRKSRTTSTRRRRRHSNRHRRTARK
jgi:hypothetical protein